MPRLPSSLSAEIYAELGDYICSHAADKYGVDFDRRIADFKVYDESLLDVYHYNRPVYPTLYTLPALLKVAGMTVQDVYNDVWHIPLHWPDNQATYVAAILDEIGNDPAHHPILDQICYLIHSFIEPWWDDDTSTEEKGKYTNPTSRIKHIYMRRIALDERDSLPDDVKDTFIGLTVKMHGASHLEIPRLCEVLHVSMHWVIGYPPEVLVLGKNSYTERFMDDFLRLPLNQRNHFEQIVTELPDFLKRQGNSENQIRKEGSAFA